MSKPNAMKVRRISDEDSAVSSGAVDNSNARFGPYFAYTFDRDIDNNDEVFYDAHSDSSSIESAQQMEAAMAQTLKDLHSFKLFTGEDGFTNPTYNADYDDLRNEPDPNECYECQDKPDIIAAAGIKVYVKDVDDENLAKEHLGKNIATWHCNWLMTWPTMYEVLIAMMMSGGFFFSFFSREFANTGGPAAWFPILEPLLLKIPVFERVISGLKRCCTIVNGWLGANYSGNHPKHQDRFSGNATHRMLFKLGRYNDKMMWFTDNVTGAEFGLLLPHGSVIMMNMTGGGVIGNLEHCAKNAEHTWLIGLDILLTASSE